MSEAEEIIARLGLERHREGGYFRETWRAAAPQGQRPAGTAIYYLLTAGERSRWHRVDADELWHFYAGAPLRLMIAARHAGAIALRLGSDVTGGQTPQAVVPAGHWQAAESEGAWTLVGCTVSPAFEYSGFELAPPGFQPKSSVT